LWDDFEVGLLAEMTASPAKVAVWENATVAWMDVG